MNAASLVNSPSTIRAPATSSIAPAAMMRGGNVPGIAAAGKCSSFMHPCSMKQSPETTRSKLSSCGDQLFKKPMSFLPKGLRRLATKAGELDRFPVPVERSYYLLQARLGIIRPASAASTPSPMSTSLIVS